MPDEEGDGEEHEVVHEVREHEQPRPSQRDGCDRGVGIDEELSQADDHERPADDQTDQSAIEYPSG